MCIKTVVGVVLVVGLLGTGCRKKEKTAEDEAASRIASRAVSLASGKDVKVDVEGETVTFTDAEGEVTVRGGKGTELPANFPKDVPVYKGAEILQTSSHAGTDFSIAFQTRDAVDKVADFYKNEMESEGWESEQALTMPNRAILAYKKGNRMVTLMIAADEDGGTVVTASVGTDG